MSGTLHGSTNIFQEISEWGWMLLWSSTLFTPRRIHWFRCPLSGSLMHPVWIPFKILNIWSYPRFYWIKFIHRWSVKLINALSGIVNVLETIGQMHKFSGNTLVAFSLTVKNGRMEFWVVFMDNGCYCQWETS